MRNEAHRQIGSRAAWARPLGVAVGSVGVGLVIWGAPGATSAAAASPNVTITGSMEGNLPVNPGDTIQAGFHISIPGNKLTHDTTVDASGGMVTMTANCDKGGSETITVNLPDQSITIPAGDTSWQPPGGQSDPAVWQGSTILPKTFCGGGGAHVPGGATFTDTLSDSDTVSLAVQFHYRDNTSGSWSSTAHITTSPPGTHTPTTSTTTTTTTTTSTVSTTQSVVSPTVSVSAASTSAPVAAAPVITTTPNTGARLPLGLGAGLVLSGLLLAGGSWMTSRRRR